MIILTGEYNGTLLYRTLGSNGAIDVNLMPTGVYVPDRHKIVHIEGTCNADCTSPTIGAGAVKLCRDISMTGYSVGTNISDKSKRPFLIDFNNEHILCYDIESELAGDAYCHYNSHMLCITLVCSCGWKLCISRCKIRKPSIKVIVREDKRSMAEETMTQILAHKPIFTLGHNIYGFDNKLLAIALGSSHAMSLYD